MVGSEGGCQRELQSQSITEYSRLDSGCWFSDSYRKP